jgi:drug/metabolite transporter (DMT)-like permease
VGVAIMIGGAALHALDDGVLAQVAILGAALSYAFAAVFGRRFRVLGIAPLATASGQVTASTIMLAPAALLVDRPWLLPWPSAHAFAAVAGLALVSTALAYVLFFRVLATAAALNAALVTFLIPVSAVLLGVLVLGETLQPRHFGGMALIWIGLAALDGRPWRALRALLRRSPPAQS